MIYNNTNFVYDIRYFDIIILLNDIVLSIYDLIEIVNKQFNSLWRFFSNETNFIV